MAMINHKKIFILLGILLISTVHSQNHLVETGDKYFKQYAYGKAIKKYLKALDRGADGAALYSNLADSYYYKSDMKGAAKWYAKLLTVRTAPLSPENYLRYAQALRATGDYDQSDKFLKKAKSRGAILEAPKDNSTMYLKTFSSKGKRYIIDPVSINTGDSEFVSTVLSDGSYLIASSRSGRIDSWTEQPFYELYQVNATTDFDLKNARIFQEINKRRNESTIAISPDGNTMYFTRNSKKAPQGTLPQPRKLKIYTAKKVDKGWQIQGPLPFTSDDYSVAHPALSADGKTLYFSSDMPGALGMSDIYSVSVNADGSYGTPHNLGTPVNTIGKETFPFVSEQGVLYFSSDGHLGLGGLDVFERVTEKGVTQIQNLGAPINSIGDDFAFRIDDSTNRGYMASNRAGGMGSDDVYRVSRMDQPCYKDLKGTVLDKKTSEPVAGIMVTVYNESSDVVANTLSGNDGGFTFRIDDCDDHVYTVMTASKGAYESTRLELGALTAVNDDILLKLKSNRPNLKDLLNLRPIYYNYNKWAIRSDSEAELDRVVAFMKRHPEITINIRSYTDSRGGNAFNMRLSNRRYKSVKDYLTSAGIASGRISGRGYGESDLVNQCSNGVFCSEADHQLNRRSEFLIEDHKED